ncbi:MAG: DUF2550 domain-containing protein [Sporichthyaceae bacterium]
MVLIIMLDVVVGMLVAVISLGLVLTLRRIALTRRVGTFRASLRRGAHDDGDGWSYGIGRYHGDRIEWYRLFSLAPRPKHVVTRRSLLVHHRRPASPAELHSVPGGSLVAVCTYSGENLELALTPGSMTGFLSWVEAAPPRDPMAR